MEKMIEKFYKSLGKNKIYGVKCKKCGEFTFPPKAGCKYCGAHNMKWQQINGEGELLFFSSGNLPPMKFAKYHPYAYGAVKLKEGPVFFTQIEGLDVSNVKKIEKQNEEMPVSVKAKIKKMAGMNIVIFKVVKSQAKKKSKRKSKK
ncbi:MAG: Zn-ribbon domain-containing OB-fold protein [Candidatus Micrarchaeia archaeon]